MKIKDIRAALTALVRGLEPAAKVVKADEREPVVRPSFRIDVLPVGGGDEAKALLRTGLHISRRRKGGTT